jgi:hypothetical protein
MLVVVAALATTVTGIVLSLLAHRLPL